MLITTDTDTLEATIEITRGHIFIDMWGVEIFLQFESGLPRWVFSEKVTTEARELWGLGLYLVVCNSEGNRQAPRKGGR